MTTEERWKTSLARGGLEDPGGRVLAELEALYSERHRKYHNLQHVRDCLDHLTENPVEGSDRSGLELAIWFHDAVYSPLKAGNEQASADLAAERLAAMGAAADLQRKVHRLIMVTTHDAEPRDLDEAVMMDVDLAVLGSERGLYGVYESAIRSEYRWVPGPLFRRKRKAILRSFLERPSIYRTDAFSARFEAAARSNLEWAISKL